MHASESEDRASTLVEAQEAAVRMFCGGVACLGGREESGGWRMRNGRFPATGGRDLQGSKRQESLQVGRG